MAQVTYQMKILTTAIISVVLFGHTLSRIKWLALATLTAGVAMVQLDNVSDPSPTAHGAGNATVGFAAVATISVTSGFASCYFEWLLQSHSTKQDKKRPISLWERNVQLAIPCLIFSLGLVIFNPIDRHQVLTRGFTYGYTPLVWLTLTTSALGGLLIAVVVREAGSVAKGFATSLAVIGKSH